MKKTLKITAITLAVLLGVLLLTVGGRYDCRERPAECLFP